MPRYRADDVQRFIGEILRREGVPEESIEIIAGHLVRANLAGMDSHGILRMPQYIEQMRSGTYNGQFFYVIDPKGEFEIAADNGPVVSVNGNLNFGQVTAWKAVHLAMERARKHGIASVSCHNTAHIGRLGDYSTLVAENDMVAVIFTSIGRIVAPFGGYERKLGTNPLSTGIPSGGEFPFVLDYATCSKAEGKIWDKHLGGHEIPVGMIVDKEGRDTARPGDLYEGGAILPFGGNLGHKGFGLGLMIELLGAMLTGTGFPGYPGYQYASSGVVMTVYDISRFTDVDTFKAGVDQIIRDVKSSKLREGFEEILIPGELEFRNMKKNAEQGIEISQGVLDKLEPVAASLDMRIGDYLKV